MSKYFQTIDLKRGGWGDTEQKGQSVRYNVNSSRGLMYSMVTVVSNTVLYTLEIAKRVDLKFSPHKKKKKKERCEVMGVTLA